MTRWWVDTYLPRDVERLETLGPYTERWRAEARAFVVARRTGLDTRIHREDTP